MKKEEEFKYLSIVRFKKSSIGTTVVDYDPLRPDKDDWFAFIGLLQDGSKSHTILMRLEDQKFFVMYHKQDLERVPEANL